MASSLNMENNPSPQTPSSSYVSMPQSTTATTLHLTPHEAAILQRVLHNAMAPPQHDDESVESDYTEFAETTHAWAVFADNPAKRATKLDRLVGMLIILFQLFTYYLFAAEAIEDYEKGQVVVTTTHANCVANDEAPDQDFQCEAEYTNTVDAMVAFFMLSVFLTPDFLQAARAIRDAPPTSTTLLFACLAGIEVVCAYCAASISVSYSLYIGEVTDAVEVGVGLLFIRELSTRAYHGIRARNKTKRYKEFFGVLASLVVLGLLLDPMYEAAFAAANNV